MSKRSTEFLYKRQFTYSILAFLFSQAIKIDHLEIFEKYNTFNNLVEDQSSEMNSAKNDLIMITQELLKDKEKAIEVLKINFDNYFLFCFGEYIPLWETIFLGKDSSLNTEVTHDTRQFYKACGYIVEDRSEMEDHLSTELAFMAILCENYILSDNKKDKEKNLEMQKKFLEQHLGKWIPKLREWAEETNICLFYKTLIIFLDVFVESDLIFVRNKEMEKFYA